MPVRRCPPRRTSNVYEPAAKRSEASVDWVGREVARPYGLAGWTGRWTVKVAQSLCSYELPVFVAQTRSKVFCNFPCV